MCAVALDADRVCFRKAVASLSIALASEFICLQTSLAGAGVPVRLLQKSSSCTRTVFGPDALMK